MTQRTRPTGMLAFTTVWAGQAISSLGSGMAWFAFTIWVWQVTGEATALVVASFLSFWPTLLLGPVAGVLVDRWNRKAVMAVSDLATGLGTVVVLLLYATESLQVWHIYIVALMIGVFWAFQSPAYSAAVTTMLPKDQYVRANSMVGLVTALADVAAPALAAFLLPSIGFVGIMVIDLATLAVATGTLLFVHIPQPATAEADRAEQEKGTKGIWKDSLYGFRYIFQRPSLLALALVFAGINFCDYLAFSLLEPMILARTNGNQVILGSVQSAGAVGAAIGGLLLIVWKGPKRRIHGVLAGCIVSSLLGTGLMGLGASLTLWMLANLISDLTASTVDSLDGAIWQAKVAPNVQGRVFTTYSMVSWITIPVGMLLAGPLADYIFEPAMMPGGSLAPMFGWLAGIGPGAGMALIFVLAGALGLLISLGGYALRAVRNIEDILPDHDRTTMLSPEAQA